MIKTPLTAEPSLIDFYPYFYTEPKSQPKEIKADNLDFTKCRRFGISYMGSKNKIVKALISQLPSAKYFIDLFAGGCAMTHGAMLSGKYERFIANDIGDAPSLFQRAIKGEFRDEKRWISRDDFFALKDSDPYVRHIWSFGNRGAGYLYSKEIEPYKKAFWEFAVFKNAEPLRAYGFNVDEFLDLPTSYERRIAFRQHLAKIPFVDKKGSHFCYKPSELKKHKGFNNNTRLDHLERLASLESLASLERLERLASLESLQSLEGLERLQSLEKQENFKSLEIHQGCYKEVELPEPNECVIYCDPPYINSEGYHKQTLKNGKTSFNHGEFYDYVELLARRGYKVFISEYEMPKDRFKSVFFIEKRQTLNGKGAGAIKQEHLFMPIV
ncbi:MAG: DNA adenine methylase [Campylobacter sp.]|nr:DNA adenine methylase [Campylobacter sp.]